MSTLPFQRLEDVIEHEILHSRRIFFCSDFNMESVEEAIKKVWYLESLDAQKEIILVINSPGGSVDAGFALWDQLKMVKCPIYTLISGMAASMGSVLSLCADKGKRFATPNSRIMIHQPSISGLVRGQATDLEIQAREIIKTRDRLIALYVEKTGKKESEIAKALDRDLWMSAQEALEFGLLDQIVEKMDQVQ